MHPFVSLPNGFVVRQLGLLFAIHKEPKSVEFGQDSSARGELPHRWLNRLHRTARLTTCKTVILVWQQATTFYCHTARGRVDIGESNSTIGIPTVCKNTLCINGVLHGK